MKVEAFRVQVSDEALGDLRRRLDGVRVPAAGDDWRAGVSGRFMRELVSYWRETFDWRGQEAWLNGYPQVRVDVDGLRVHAVHVGGQGDNPLPLVLTHGWPSTFAEFLPIIDRLTDPVRYGGRPEDAFSVVVPTLPGFVFSDPLPDGEGHRIAKVWAGLMEALGYHRFAAHGGDIGAYVTNQLALHFPERLVGMHTTYPAEPWLGEDPDLTGEEEAFLRDRLVGRERGGGYAHIQRTRPETLAYALNDSPAGLAAWIIDKWQEWSDQRLPFEQRFSADTLLTTVMLYWLTGSIGDSFRLYREWALGGPPAELLAEIYPHALPGIEPTPLASGQRVTVPTGIALFNMRFPRSFVDRAYADIRRWTDMPRGGHFPALEEPDLLVDDLRSFFRDLRS